MAALGVDLLSLLSLLVVLLVIALALLVRNYRAEVDRLERHARGGTGAACPRCGAPLLLSVADAGAVAPAARVEAPPPPPPAPPSDPYGGPGVGP